MKAQASTEYVILIAVVLVALIPIFYFALQKSNTDIKINQVDDAVNALAKAANSVYSLGPGTKDHVWITMPEGVQDIIINGTEINIKISLLGKISDVHASTIGNVTGYISTNPGTYKIPVEALSNGIVLVGAVNDTDPPTVTFTSPSGEISEREPILSATTNEDADCKYDETDKEYSEMSNFFDGSGLVHTDQVGPLDDDNYTYYVRCRDVIGNTMTSSALIQFMVNTTGLDTDNPDVFLEQPDDGTTRNFNFVNFIYNVTDNTSGIDYCRFYAYGELDNGGNSIHIVIDNSVEEGVSEVLGVTLQKGNHTWNITCVDDSSNQNEGISETRWLRVNETQQGSYVTSCVGWCGFEGLSSGFCTNTPNACDDDCGLPYPPKSCYAGDEVSDNYCLGGEQANTCCCIL